MFNRVEGLPHTNSKRSLGGFTIIELLTVMAITGVLFIGVITLVQTQNVRSQFAQGISDLDSKINKYITDIHSAVDETAQNYTCKGYPNNPPNPQRPVLTNAPGSGNIGTNGDCLFLGKAFQVNPGTSSDNSIYVYPVLGNRLMADPAGGANPVPIDSFFHANPEPSFVTCAVVSSCTYTIPYGLKVTKSTYTINSSPFYDGKENLVGFYNSLDSSATNAQIARAYTFSATNLPNSSSAKLCIEEDPTCSPIDTYPSASPASYFSRWDLCLQYSSIKALFSVVPTSAGIRTVISYSNIGSCP